MIMKTKLLFVIAFLFFFSFRSFSQTTEQYCFRVSHYLFENCPPGTYFKICIRWVVCTCPEDICCSENERCGRVDSENLTFCADIPSNAKTVQWIFSKFNDNSPALSLGTETLTNSSTGGDFDGLCTNIKNCTYVNLGEHFAYSNNQHTLDLLP